MNILIATDMEGVCSIDRRIDLKKGTPAYQRSCKLLTLETNAAVQASLEAGAKKVFVIDGHSKGDNLILEKLHKDAIIVPKEESFGMISGISPSIDFVAFIGYHGMANKRKSFICHNNSGKTISQLSINGIEISEGCLCAMMAKVYGIKVIFFSGTDTGVREIKRHISNLPALITKDSLSYSEAKSLPLENALKGITSGIKEGIQKNKEIEFTRLPCKDITVQIKVPYTYYLDVLTEQIEGATITDNCALEISAKDAIEFYKKYAHFRSLVSDYLKKRESLS